MPGCVWRGTLSPFLISLIEVMTSMEGEVARSARLSSWRCGRSPPRVPAHAVAMNAQMEARTMMRAICMPCPSVSVRQKTDHTRRKGGTAQQSVYSRIIRTRVQPNRVDLIKKALQGRLAVPLMNCRDLAIAADDDHMRNSLDTVRFPGSPGFVTDQRHQRRLAPEKLPDFEECLATLPPIDREHHELLPGSLLLQGHQHRYLLLARSAPRGPEGNHHDSTPIVTEMDDFAGRGFPKHIGRIVPFPEVRWIG